MRQKIDSLVRQAIAALIEEGPYDAIELPDTLLERPRDKTHGDWASTAALKLSKQMGINPRELAEAIAARLAADEAIASVEVAGPGFINLTLSEQALHEEIAAVHAAGPGFAKSDIGGGQRVNVEFISANPTGPMHVGHGRWAALGNALCKVLEHAGWQVTREFYINDAGHQMDVFANSVVLRYRELLGETVELPEEFYGGAYIIDIARLILEEEGDRWHLEAAAGAEAGSVAAPAPGDPAAPAPAPGDPAAPAPGDPVLIRMEHFRERAYRLMLESIQTICQRVEVPFDVWFSERSLYQADGQGTSPIQRMLERLGGLGHLYESEGATWFRATTFGDDKDRVLVKSDGSYTYFCPDIAYHLDKLERASQGSEQLINIWGADHHGYVSRMQAAMAAVGHDGCLQVLLGQLVNLYRAGEAVRMSKRTGEMVTFEELLDEVGADATKYLMLGRAADQPIDFDIEAAKRADASNPVYYVQYAHARICSLLRRTAEQGLAPDPAGLAGLTDSSELELARIFSRLQELIESAAHDLAPWRLTHYAEELAAAFHSFYTRCPVLGAEQELAEARLYLADATRQVLALVLGLLGVSAPERM